MKNTLINIAKFSLIIAAAVSVNLLASTASGAEMNFTTGVQSAHGQGVPTTLFGNDTGIISQIINVMLFLVGIVSVIMVIIGGFKYVLSGGDSSKVTSAKNTVLYAIIGLIIAILAYAIINFIVSAITGSSSGLINSGGGGGAVSF